MPVVHIIFILDRLVLSVVYNILAVYQTHDFTMVLTVAQMTTFFEHAEQMGIPHATVLQLQSEGITLVSDLVDFNKNSLQQLADNLRRPGGCVPDPNPGAPPGSTIPTPPFVFGAKSQRCIAITCDLVKYYTTVSRDLTAANLQWNTVMKNFNVQWTVLKERKGDDSPETPKISKALPVIKWMEAFQDFLNWKIGNRNIPLAYIIRDEPNPPAAAPPLAAGQPHSIEHGSVKLSSQHEHHIPMHYSVTITLTYTSSWRKQHEALNMLPLSNPSNDLGMVMEHGGHLPANMLGKTSGRLRSRSKSNCCTHVSGKARVTSLSNTSSPNIAMHMYQCLPVQNTFNTSCLTNALALVF